MVGWEGGQVKMGLPPPVGGWLSCEGGKGQVAISISFLCPAESRRASDAARRTGLLPSIYHLLPSITVDYHQIPSQKRCLFCQLPSALPSITIKYRLLPSITFCRLPSNTVCITVYYHLQLLLDSHSPGRGGVSSPGR